MSRGGLQVGGNYRGEWEPDVSYNANDLVSYQGSIYPVKVDHVSGATFNASAVLSALSAGSAEAILAAGGATTDDLFWHIFDDTSPAVADGTRKRFGCPFDLEVVSLSIWSLGSVAASATDYWTCDLRKFIATDATHTAQLIASKTTRTAPNGEGFAVLTPWTFDAVIFDPVNRFCVRGDLVDILWTKTLNPTAMTRMNYTLRYRPV